MKRCTRCCHRSKYFGVLIMPVEHTANYGTMERGLLQVGDIVCRSCLRSLAHDGTANGCRIVWADGQWRAGGEPIFGSSE